MLKHFPERVVFGKRNQALVRLPQVGHVAIRRVVQPDDQAHFVFEQVDGHQPGAGDRRVIDKAQLGLSRRHQIDHLRRASRHKVKVRVAPFVGHRRNEIPQEVVSQGMNRRDP
ncbi:hypothetical protein D3C71_1531320 [compost metagenome]